MQQLVDLLCETAGRDVQVLHEGVRAGEILRNYSLIDRARSELGFAPAVDLAEGLRRTWDWFTVPAGE